MSTPAANDGQAVVEYELIVPNSRPIALTPGSVTSVHAVIHESVHGAPSCKHRIQAASTTFVDTRIKAAMASGTGRLRFRLGVGTPDTMFWLPWQEHVITQCTAAPESIGSHAGHALEIETQDYMSLFSRTTKTASRKGTVSQIVENICEEWSLTARAIERTVGDGTYVQSFVNDARFIRERMLVRARNDRGRGNFLFYFKDNALHFHSPDYQAELHTLVYSQSNSTSLVQVDRSQHLMAYGNAGVRTTTHNPATGQTKVILSDPSKALKLSDSVYQLSQIPGSSLEKAYHVGVNFQDEAEVIGQNTYEMARAETFNLRLEVAKTIQIRHGDFVNLIVAPAGDRTSPWSGLYHVTEVKHAVQKGTVTSAYVLSRGEIKKSLANLTVAENQNQIVSEQDAPGQALNVAEMTNSQRTKGAGSLAANGKLFSTVVSPR